MVALILMKGKEGQVSQVCKPKQKRVKGSFTNYCEVTVFFSLFFVFTFALLLCLLLLIFWFVSYPLLIFPHKKTNQPPFICVAVGEMERLFQAASHQKAWDHFTKAQRKSLESWRKHVTVCFYPPHPLSILLY